MPSGAVTAAVTVQVPLDEIEPPERLMVPEPGDAVVVPPQVELKPLGLATTKPGGRASVKATPVSAAKLFGFAMERLTVVVPPGRNLLGVKALVITGGATTSSVAEAWFPAPAIAAKTLPEMLFCTPALMPATITLKVQDPPAGIVPPERPILLGASTTVPEQLLLPALVTDNPAGSASLTPTPVIETAFGFVIVKVRLVFPPSGIEATPKDLLMVGGDRTVKVADAKFPAPPSLDITGVVVLSQTPGSVSVILMLTVQVLPGDRPLVPADIAALTKLKRDEPEVAPLTVPPQVFVRLGVFATSIPATRGSLKPTPVRFDVKLFGLRIVIVRVEVPFTGIAAGLKSLLMTGATGVALYPTASSTAISTPPSLEMSKLWPRQPTAS
jgi:hypothetical protein